MLRLKLITITPDARAERQPAPVVNHLQHARRSRGEGRELSYRILTPLPCGAAAVPGKHKHIAKGGH